MKVLMTILAALMLAFGVMAIAEDKPAESGMPPMGAPEQMKDIAFLNGNWSVAMQWRDMQDSSKWTDEKATCTFKHILDGAAVEMDFNGDMMNMPFQGLMLLSYDRDKNEWQSTWIDNLGAKLSFYTGTMTGGKMSLTGEDMWQGKTYLNRMNIFNMTDKKFDWSIENSFDGGKTWLVMGKAVYTKM